MLDRILKITLWPHLIKDPHPRRFFNILFDLCPWFNIISFSCLISKNSTKELISASETQTPCTRIGLGNPVG